MLLTERDRQLDHLRQLLEESVGGSGRIAIVSGPVGTGKTALLHEFSEYAADSGAHSLTGVGARAEQTVSFGLLRQLFRSVMRSPEISARVTELLEEGTRFLAGADPAARASSRIPAQVLDGLSVILLDLAEQHPLFLGVDDLQYADGPSLQGLLYFVRRLRCARILVMLNEAAGSESAHSPFRTDCLSLPYCRRIWLSPLSPRGLVRILAERLGEQKAVDLAPAWYDVSGGNPLLIQALVEDYERSSREAPGEPGDDLVAGTAFSQAMLNCLHRCEPRLLHIAQTLAVLDQSGSPALVARLTGTELEAAMQAMSELNAAGLLERGVFRHPAAASAVRSGLSPAARTELHLRAARCLHDDGAPATSIAQHLVAAAGKADPWGIPILHEAAESLLADDQVATAVACLELAYRSCTGEEQRAQALSMLASAEWRTNPSAVGRYLPQLAQAIRDGHLRDRHAAAAIRYLLWYGRSDEALAALKGLHGSAADQPDTDLAAGLRFTWMWMSASYPGVAGSIPPPTIPDTRKGISPAAAPSGIRAASVLTSLLAQGSDNRSVVEAEKVLESSRLTDQTAESLELALFSLIYADRLDKANYWYESLIKEARARQAPWWKAMLSSVRAEIAIRQGDLLTAKTYADSALTLASLRSWGVAAGIPLAILVTASTAMARYEEAAGYLDQPVPEEIFQTRFGLHYLHGRGHYYLARGRCYAALEDFLACGELMTSWGCDLPALVSWRTDVAEAYLRLGEPGEAEKLVKDHLALLGGTRSRARGIALRLLAVASEPRRRPQLLIEAAEVLQECDDRFELAKVLADLSHAYHALGDLVRARTMMRRAWHAAKECQAEILCQELLPDLAENNIDVPLIDSVPVDKITTLTSAERRVAVLAAQGRSNRDIAKELYVTVSTVEQHLTRVYRKLKVTRREGLPLRLPSAMADRA